MNILVLGAGAVSLPVAVKLSKAASVYTVLRSSNTGPVTADQSMLPLKEGP